MKQPLLKFNNPKSIKILGEADTSMDIFDRVFKINYQNKFGGYDTHYYVVEKGKEMRMANQYEVTLYQNNWERHMSTYVTLWNEAITEYLESIY